jgi:hypothetical protein
MSGWNVGVWVSDPDISEPETDYKSDSDSEDPCETHLGAKDNALIIGSN